MQTAQVRFRASVFHFNFSFFLGAFIYFFAVDKNIDRLIVSAYLIPPPPLRHKIRKNTGYASFIRSYSTCGTKGSGAKILQQHLHGIAAFTFLPETRRSKFTLSCRESIDAFSSDMNVKQSRRASHMYIYMFHEPRHQKEMNQQF